MALQDALSISLYSQLFEDAVANECIALCPGMNGSFAKEKRKGVNYWYWSGRDIEGKIRKIYIGMDNDKTSELIARLEYRKNMAVQSVNSMKKTAAAYLSAGGQTNYRSHFKIIAYLAQKQLFRKGVLLIGSHAYISICNALCIRGGIEYAKTNDIDFARPRSISLAIPDEREFISDIPEALKSFDNKFFLVPELNGKYPSTSIKNNKLGIKVDFLTAKRDGGEPVFFKDIGIAADPLPFMEYLLASQPIKGLVIGDYAIPVHLPQPARFAIHKLIISEERQPHLQSKKIKDIKQASVLLDCLIEDFQEEVIDALSACLTMEGAVKNIKKSLLMLRKINISASRFIEERIDLTPSP
ncbi:MAG: GSU2403 family nucleotidyltransferase fold protein [Methylomonas sp.]